MGTWQFGQFELLELFASIVRTALTLLILYYYRNNSVMVVLKVVLLDLARLL
jgi:hypothetical protein